MADIWYVDIPDKDTIGTENPLWFNLEVFHDKTEAVNYCLKNIVNDISQVELFITHDDDGND